MLNAVAEALIAILPTTVFAALANKIPFPFVSTWNLATLFELVDFTDNCSKEDTTPIPTFPLLAIRILSVPCILKI